MRCFRGFFDSFICVKDRVVADVSSLETGATEEGVRNIWRTEGNYAGNDFFSGILAGQVVLRLYAHK